MKPEWLSRWTVRLAQGLPLLFVAAVAVYYGCFTLRRPYHLDTVLHLDSVRALLERGVLETAFPSRVGNTLLYLPGVALAGEAGLVWTSVVVVVATTALYFLTLRVDFGDAVALAAAVSFATAPAVILTATHLKEDANALLLALAALALAGRAGGGFRSIFAGALCGLGVLTKEYGVAFVPFVAAQMFVWRGRPEAVGDFVRPMTWQRAWPTLAAFLAGAGGIILLVSPGHFGILRGMTSSPYQAQFLGLQQLLTGGPWSAWREGTSHLSGWAPFAVVALIVAARARRWTPILWAGAGAVLFVLLSTTTVTVGRIFGPVILLMMPVAWSGVRLALRTAAAKLWPLGPVEAVSDGAVLLVAVVLASWHVADVTPTLAYRKAYPPQARYFEGLGRATPPGTVLYGMDNCSVATYFTGLPCRTHPVDATPEVARAFVDGLVAEAKRRPVLLLHDFEAYDNGAIATNLAMRANAPSAYAALGEDYHGLSWPGSWDGEVERIETTTDCRGIGVTRSPSNVPAPGFEVTTMLFACGSPGEETVQSRVGIGFRGRPTALGTMSVRRLEPW
ncbi:MAG: glycosyltransferase family 39 protein [Anaeromyxobacteraceae bacterium]